MFSSWFLKIVCLFHRTAVTTLVATTVIGVPMGSMGLLEDRLMTAGLAHAHWLFQATSKPVLQICLSFSLDLPRGSPGSVVSD